MRHPKLFSRGALLRVARADGASQQLELFPANRLRCREIPQFFQAPTQLRSRVNSNAPSADTRGTTAAIGAIMKLSNTLAVVGLSVAPLLMSAAAYADAAHADADADAHPHAHADKEKVRRDERDERDENVNRDNPSLPAVAANTPSGAFGDKGELTVSSDAGLSISSTSISGVSGSTTELTLRPAVDYFIANNVSLGGFLGLDYTSAHGAHTTQFSIGPRVGYNVAFSERFSFWPKIGFSYSTTSASTTLDVAGLPPGTQISESNSGSSLALNIFAPVMFHPVQHFFLGFGPALDTDLTGDVKSTTIAGRLTIGGWF